MVAERGVRTVGCWVCWSIVAVDIVSLSGGVERGRGKERGAGGRRMVRLSVVVHIVLAHCLAVCNILRVARCCGGVMLTMLLGLVRKHIRGGPLFSSISHANVSISDSEYAFDLCFSYAMSKVIAKVIFRNVSG